MESGIYEQLITKILRDQLDRSSSQYFINEEPIDPAESAVRLSRYLCRVIFNILESIPHTDETGRLNKQIALCNTLMEWLKSYSLQLNLDTSESLLDPKGKMLTALFLKQNLDHANIEKHIQRITPDTGLSQSELFTGSNARVPLDRELKREILSADSICWLVSFIKWTGIRIFQDELEEFTRSGRKLRVITTSYMGATDLKAVEFLANLPNTEVKISYNTQQERLHAKAYLFLRNTGYHTAYIGSSNISRSALTNGLEWNLKVTTQEIPQIIEKFQSTFETYWEAPEFELFKTENKDRLKRALYIARGEEDKKDENEFFFDIQPHIHQKEMLEKLVVEREIHNRWRNLIVAATGTGKTVISAFDFQRYYRTNPQTKFLYVAHREEILKQALSTFRGILRKSSFGDLWVGKSNPERYDQLFVSVQMLNNNLSSLNLTSDYYDFIIIDEVHHIAADSYRKIIDYFSPKILLGLTATPERHDGSDILKDFCNTIAAELRLPEAINRRYLCPFQYFCIDDEVDLSKVTWERGRYRSSELSNLYLGNDRRVMEILRNMQNILNDMTRIKALGFCVSQEHARYMAEQFQRKGIKSAALTSENSVERESLRSALVQGQINVLFVVDIFNEGIDIPEVDTLLFLRPTESLTIFLQQLGRGLRFAEGKECLTVLDFVGNSRPEYDFAQKFRALVGKTHNSIEDEVKSDFPNLPLGCSILLQRKSKEIILKNIQNAIFNKRKIVNLISTFNQHSHLPLTLRNFLQVIPSLSLEDIYSKDAGWYRLCIEAGLELKLDVDLEKLVYKGIFNRLLQCTSRSFLEFFQKLIRQDFHWQKEDPVENQMAMMAYCDFWQTKPSFSTLEEALSALGRDPILKSELEEVISLLLESLEVRELPMNIGEPTALSLHARYSRDQILAAFGAHNFEKRASSREGVFEIKDRNLELLFVTLQKSEKRFSPTTLYHDYAISEKLFHWQSQNSARPDRGKGLSYIQQKQTGKRIILFAREMSKDEQGRTLGFVNLGPVEFYSSHGSQPMNITWRLQEPIPAYLWNDAAKLASA